MFLFFGFFGKTSKGKKKKKVGVEQEVEREIERKKDERTESLFSSLSLLAASQFLYLDALGQAAQGGHVKERKKESESSAGENENERGEVGLENSLALRLFCCAATTRCSLTSFPKKTWRALCPSSSAPKRPRLRACCRSRSLPPRPRSSCIFRSWPRCGFFSGRGREEEREGGRGKKT